MLGVDFFEPAHQLSFHGKAVIMLLDFPEQENYCKLCTVYIYLFYSEDFDVHSLWKQVY